MVGGELALFHPPVKSAADNWRHAKCASRVTVMQGNRLSDPGAQKAAEQDDEGTWLMRPGLANGLASTTAYARSTTDLLRLSQGDNANGDSDKGARPAKNSPKPSTDLQGAKDSPDGRAMAGVSESGQKPSSNGVDAAAAASSQWLSLVVTVWVALMYMAASGIAILINRHILVDLDFQYPVTITWISLVTTTIGSGIVVHVWLPTSSRRGVTGQYYLTHVMPCGFFMAVAFLTGNLSFMFLTLAFVQMLKASTPIVTMLLLFAFKLERATSKLVVSVCIICAGVCVAGYGEVRVSLIGLASMLTSVAAESLRLVLMQFLMDPKGGELHPMEGLMYISSACMVWLMAQAMLWEWTSILEHKAYLKIMEQPLPFLVSATAGFGVNLLAILVIKRASSLTLKVLGTVKDAALVVISVVLLQEQVSHLQLVGYVVSLVGFVAYNIAKAGNHKTDSSGQPSTAPASIVKLA